MATGRAARVESRKWEHLDGEVFITPASQALNLPAGCTIVSLEVENAGCYYAVNHSGAAAGSHGYCPQNGQRVIGPLSNLNTMHVHSIAGTVHVQYFREA